MADDWSQFQDAPQSPVEAPQSVPSAHVADDYAHFSDAPQTAPQAASGAAGGWDAAAVSDAINGGKSDAEVIALIKGMGVDPSKVQNLGAALQYRTVSKTPIPVAAATPNDPVPVGRAPVDHGKVGSFLHGGADGLTLGFSDELAGGAHAVGNSVGNLIGLGNGKSFADDYTGVRDDLRQSLKDDEALHPYATTAGQVASALATIPLGGGEVGLGRLALQGAGAGALYGLGSGEGSFGDQLGSTVKGGLEGGALAGTIGTAAHALSPTMSASVKYLLDAGVPLTTGQLAASRGGVLGTIAKKIEETARNLPISGTAIQRAQDNSLVGFNRHVIGNAVDDTIGSKYVPTNFMQRAQNMLNNEEVAVDSARKAQFPRDPVTGHFTGTTMNPDLPAMQAAFDQHRTALDVLRDTPNISLGRASPVDLQEAVGRYEAANGGSRMPGNPFGAAITHAIDILPEEGGVADKTAKTVNRGIRFAGAIEGLKYGGLKPLVADALLAPFYSSFGQAAMRKGFQTAAESPVMQGARYIGELLGPRAVMPAQAYFGSSDAPAPQVAPRDDFDQFKDAK